jgi:hypothetical protein
MGCEKFSLKSFDFFQLIASKNFKGSYSFFQNRTDNKLSRFFKAQFLNFGVTFNNGKAD